MSVIEGSLYLSNVVQSFLVLLRLSPSESQLHHSILTVEEPAFLPLTAHLLQHAVPHVLHLIDEDILILVTAITDLFIHV